MLMNTFTHNPTCTLVLSRTNRAVEFFLDFFYVCFFFFQSVLSEKNPVLSQLLVSCGFSSSIFSLRLFMMAQISLRFVEFGSSGN